MKSTTYTLTIRCDHPAYANCDLLLTARGFDEQGNPCGFYSLNQSAADCPTPHTSRLDCGPCASVSCYLYILPHQLPEVRETEQVPAFEAELTLSEGREELHHQRFVINPWGGASLSVRWPLSD